MSLLSLSRTFEPSTISKKITIIATTFRRDTIVNEQNKTKKDILDKPKNAQEEEEARLPTEKRKKESSSTDSNGGGGGVDSRK